MGWRTTAQNYNRNRDYLKADAPEMQAMLALVDAWDPILYVDLHVTEGAKFRQDVSYQVEPGHAGDKQLREERMAMSTALVDQVAEPCPHPLTFYPTFVEDTKTPTHFVAGVAPP